MDDKICTYCGMAGHRASRCPRRPRERDIERHLVRAVTARNGLVRKVTWQGRRGAPDRLVMLPGRYPVWVELKAPGERPTQLQEREHAILRSFGQRVEVIDSTDGVDRLLA